MKNKIVLILIGCALHPLWPLWGQESNVLTGVGTSVGSYGGAGIISFPSLDRTTGGSCIYLSDACSTYLSDFSTFNSNPAISSLMYGTPFIGYSFIRLPSGAAQYAVAFLQNIEQIGFGVQASFYNNPLTEYIRTSSDANFEQIGLAQYLEYIISLNFSYNVFRMGIIDGISIGLNADTIIINSFEKYIPDSVDAALAADIGVLFSVHALKIIDFVKPNLLFSAVVSNVGVGLKDDRALLPTSATLGLSYSPIQEILIAFDLGFKINQARVETNAANLLVYSLGAKIAPLEWLEIGGGMKIHEYNLSFSAGLGLNILGLRINIQKDFSSLYNSNILEGLGIFLGLDVQNTIQPQRRLQVQKLYLQALRAFSLNDLETALELTQQALVVSPNYLPAIELRKQVESVQRSREILE